MTADPAALRYDRYLELTLDGTSHDDAVEILDREIPLDFRCRRCKKPFATNNGLGRHLEKFHGETA